jgi:hypothetical protein
MQLHKIHQLNNNKICDLLHSEFSSLTDERFIKNYNPIYSNLSENIFYLLKQGAFSSGLGSYFILVHNDEFICSAGWTTYRENPEIALLLSRTYVSLSHRGKFHLAEYILPECLKETAKFKNRYITINKHNKYLINGLLRPGLSNHWPDIYRKFKFLGLQNINFTEQLVFEYHD